MNTKIAGRDYVMGRGVLNSAGRKRILVIDVAANRIVSEHQTATEATEAMIMYAKDNGIMTQMAIAADFGDDPIIITETY